MLYKSRGGGNAVRVRGAEVVSKLIIYSNGDTYVRKRRKGGWGSKARCIYTYTGACSKGGKGSESAIHTYTIKLEHAVREVRAVRAVMGVIHKYTNSKGAYIYYKSGKSSIREVYIIPYGSQLLLPLCIRCRP